MSLLALAGTNSATGGYDIDNSCKFEDDNDEWLYRTNVSGTNTKTWTVSWWFKQTELRSVNGAAAEMWHGGAYGEATRAGIFADDRIWIDIGGGDGNTGTRFRSLSSARLRDTAAWYHIVIACDSTQSTEADRLKVWLNGVEVTAWDQKQYPTLNFGSALAGFGGIQMKWGSYDATYHGFCGYLAECNYVDGITATQNDFGEFDDDSGIWKPKEYTGSYGTNGSYLDFTNASDLGNDESGNGNDYTLNNITSADQATDTPTNNFATGNPLGPFRVGAWNFTEGATYAQYAGGNDWGSFTSTIAVGSGKWYVEIQAGGSDLFIGAGSEDFNFVGAGSGTGFPEIYYGYTGTNSVGYHANNGNIYNNGSASAIGSTYTTNDIISVALDMDNGKIYFAKNGTYINSQNPATGANSIALPDTSARYFIGGSSYGTGKNHRCNYGGYTSFTISSSATDANGYGTFEYAPPTGYYALCSKNLAEYG